MLDAKTIYGLLGYGESTMLEFKTARGGFPLSFWTTYSAFANTDGGVIVLGVKEKNKLALVDGLTRNEVIALKKLFWDTVNNRQKISISLLKDKEVHIEEIPEE